jgi:RHS repeat-associated protein
MLPVYKPSVFISLLLFASTAISQVFGGGGGGGGTTEPGVLGIVPEYIERQNVEERLSMYGDNILGDQIDLNTGSLQFSQTDLSLPGNFSLQVAFTRTRSTSYNFGQHDSVISSVLSKANGPTGPSNYLGDWQIDVPKIEWIYPVPLTSTQNTTAPAAASKNFCGSSNTPSIFPYNYNDPQAVTEDALHHYQLSSGMKLHVPGNGVQTLLNTPKGVNWPTGTVKVTTQHWKGSCISANNSASGLLFTSPDGTKYKFDRFVYRPAETIGFHYYWNGETYSSIVPRVTSTLLATEVTDVNGNWVKYNYSSEGRLNSIQASDGRLITVGYTGNKVSSVNANERQWSYQYTNNSSGIPTLTSVTRPDGRAWSFNLNPIHIETNDTFDCASPDNTWQMTHPSGVQGTFVFTETKHEKSLVQGGVFDSKSPTCASNGQPQNVNFYKTKSVKSKTLVGPGYPSANWQFQYVGSPSNSQTKWGQSIAPDGTRKREIFHLNSNQALEGLKKREELYSPTNQLLSSTDFEYVVEAALGNTFLANEHQAKLVSPRHMTKQVVKRGADDYTTEYTYNTSQNTTAYSFGAPTQINEFNDVNNYTRVQTKTYQQMVNIWRLNLPLRVVNNGKEVMLNTYDSLGRLSTVRKNGSNVDYASMAYHTAIGAKGAIHWIQDAGGDKTYALNWKRGTPQEVRRADGESTFQYVDNNGWIIQEIDYENNCTNYSHDSVGRLTGIDYCNPYWNDTTISYATLSTNDGLPNVETGMFKQTISKGNLRRLVYYDAMYRPIIEKSWDTTDPTNSRFNKYAYDVFNRDTFQGFPATSSNSSFGVVKTYDALGRLKTLDDNTTAGIITYSYLSGNRVSVNDNKGNVTTTTYHAYGNPEQSKPTLISSPEGIITALTYSNQGLVTHIAQGGVTERRWYDNDLRLCKTVRPDVGNAAFAYDVKGRMAWRAQGASISSTPTNCDYSVNAIDKTTYTYNTINQVTYVNHGDNSPDVSLTYTVNGQVAQNQAGNVTLDYGYDSLGNVTSETLLIDARVMNLQYSYDENGALQSTTYPSSNTVNYTPNAFGEATQISGYASGATYHTNGQLKTLAYTNGFGLVTTQTTNGTPATMVHKKGGLYALNHAFTFDANNNLTFLDDRYNSAYDLRLTYDGVDRLKTIVDSYSGSGHVNYDTMGNITQYKVGSRTINYVYNGQKQLDYVTGSHSANYSFDDKGNVVNNGSHSFHYNTAGQMDSSGAFSYVYDGNNKRVKQEDGKTSYSFYGASGKLMYRFEDNKHVDYYYLAGKLTAKRKDDEITYLHSDFLGSPAAESNSAGAVERMHYQPFGESIGTPKDDVGYTGHKFDTALGLSYMQARYYDPVIGRFYSNDPVGYTSENPVMSFNRYLYVNNNPYKYTDPNGEFLNFAVKFVADIALGATLNYLETGEVNIGGALIDAAVGVLNPAKTLQKAKRLAKVIKGGCSFTPETMILTKDGYKSIIEVNVGDIVLSKNDETGEVSWRKVTDTFKDWHKETISFTVVDENGIEESITTTAEHPFYVDNQGWLPAGDLSEGTVISGPKADNNISIVKVQLNQEPQYAYNFTVDTDHTYFVGKTNMWVHNACNKSGKLVTGKTQPQVGDQIDTGEYSNRVKVSGDNPKMTHPKTGNYLQKDRAKNSGSGTHGTSENKLFNKKGGRVGTVDKDGNITRD